MHAELALSIAKSVDDSEEGVPIAIEIGGARASDALLNLRPCWNVSQPGGREVEGDPLDEGPLNEACRRAGSLFSQTDEERIVQMAEHLMCRHSPPAAFASGAQRGDPKGKIFLDTGVSETLHKSFRFLSRSCAVSRLSCVKPAGGNHGT